MQLTRLSGTVTQITPPDKNGDIHCVVGSSQASLATDLMRQTEEGDQVTLAGELHDDVVHALAMNNGRNELCRTIDASNIAIILSFSIFVGVITGILALQQIGGENNEVAIFGAISIAALGYSTSLLMRIFRINRSSRIVQFG